MAGLRGGQDSWAVGVAPRPQKRNAFSALGSAIPPRVTPLPLPMPLPLPSISRPRARRLGPRARAWAGAWGGTINAGLHPGRQWGRTVTGKTGGDPLDLKHDGGILAMARRMEARTGSRAPTE